MATLEHSLITDPNIHEPKGVAAADDGQIYVADGAGSGVWTDPADIEFDIGSTGSFTSDLELYKNESTSNFSSGWADRSSGLSWTEATNNIASASVSTNNISLPAGTYVVEALGSFIPVTVNNSTTDCLLRVRDTTSNITLVVGQTNTLLSRAASGGNETNEATPEGKSGCICTLKGRFTLGGTKTVRLQFYSSDSTYPLNPDSDAGEAPVTAFIRFWKIA